MLGLESMFARTLLLPVLVTLLLARSVHAQAPGAGSGEPPPTAVTPAPAPAPGPPAISPADPSAEPIPEPMQVPIKLPLTLEWRGAPGCPSEDEARSEVEGAAAKLVTEVSRVRAEVVLRRDDVYELSMWMYTPSARHHKVLSARLCSTLLRLITLELRHSQLPEGLVHQAAEPREHTFSTRAGAIVGTGPTPRPAPGVTLGVGSRFAQARIELNFNYFMPHASPHKSAARSDLSAFTVDARGCFAPRVWRLELSVCGGAEAGSVNAKDGAPSGSALWGALFVVPGARLQVHKPVWVWAEVGPWFALRRPHFAPPDRPDLVSVRGAGGLALQFE